MAAELQPSSPTPSLPHKRKHNPRSSKKPTKKPKSYPRKTQKPSQKMQKLFRKRATDYHSSDEEEEEEEPAAAAAAADVPEEDHAASSGSDVEEPKNAQMSEEDEEEEEEEAMEKGVTKLVEGCKGFRVAFEKIMKKLIPNEPLGPVLSANKGLLAEKLAEEVTERKAKAETRKQKLVAQEKGHVVPASFLDVKEKHLISVATKGVVKLFNAVSKAQSTKQGLESSKSKDAKALAKRRKQTFLSELKKPAGEAGNPSSNASKDNEEPGWAPLRDSYMLTSSKLKNWDKQTDTAVDDNEKVPMDSSSDDE